MATETATNVVVAFWSFHFNNLILHLALPNFRWLDQNYTMQSNCFCLVVSPPWSKWEKWSREPVTPDQNVQHSVSNAETKFTRFCETRIRISSGILVLICVSKLFDAIVKKKQVSWLGRLMSGRSDRVTPPPWKGWLSGSYRVIRRISLLIPSENRPQVSFRRHHFLAVNHSFRIHPMSNVDKGSLKLLRLRFINPGSWMLLFNTGIRILAVLVWGLDSID